MKKTKTKYPNQVYIMHDDDCLLAGEFPHEFINDFNTDVEVAVYEFVKMVTVSAKVEIS